MCFLRVTACATVLPQEYDLAVCPDLRGMSTCEPIKAAYDSLTLYTQLSALSGKNQINEEACVWDKGCMLRSEAFDV